MNRYQECWCSCSEVSLTWNFLTVWEWNTWPLQTIYILKHEGRTEERTGGWPVSYPHRGTYYLFPLALSLIRKVAKPGSSCSNPLPFWQLVRQFICSYALNALLFTQAWVLSFFIHPSPDIQWTIPSSSRTALATEDKQMPRTQPVSEESLVYAEELGHEAETSN